ncbi:MAG: transposase [Parvibaculum sp.]
MEQKKRRRRWTKAERAHLVRQARVLIADGGSWHSAAKALGVWPSSLQRWDRAASKPSFKPVVPVAATPATATSASTLAVTTPDGFRVEGLDVDAAYLLLEMLR